MSNLRARFAAEIRVARLAAGMTQEQLADAASTSVDFVSKMERGLHSPSLEILAALVQALSLDPGRVLGIKLIGPMPTTARLQLEARLSQLSDELDDNVLAALVEIARTLKHVVQNADPSPKTHAPGRRRR